MGILFLNLRTHHQNFIQITGFQSSEYESKCSSGVAITTYRCNITGNHQGGRNTFVQNSANIGHGKGSDHQVVNIDGVAKTTTPWGTKFSLSHLNFFYECINIDNGAIRWFLPAQKYENRG